MAKKRSCRRSELERTQHDTAVKIRKMTDEQLCNFLCDIENKCRNENGIEKFLGRLEELKGSGNGISTGMIAKLKRIAAENSFITEETV